MTARPGFRRALHRLLLALVLAAVLGPLLLARPVPARPSPAGAVRAAEEQASGDVLPVALDATRWVMGTALRVVIAPSTPGAEAALEAAFAEAERLDALLSDYDPASPLSRLNANPGAPIPVGPALREYLSRALRDSDRTDGAFDITVGALTRLHRRTVGDDDEAGARRPRGLEAARACVGYWRVEITPAGAVVLPPGMSLDPGGDGKGVAVDAIVRTLRARQVRNAFVDFGRSSLYGLGTPGDGAAGWDVLLEDDCGQPLGVVTLRDAGLSTSSSRRTDAGGGAPRGHIVDPRTGALVSVARTAAVLSAGATEGDVLSTALVVEGQAGLRWTDRFPDTTAAVFERAGPDSSAGRTSWVQPAFAKHFRAALSRRS